MKDDLNSDKDPFLKSSFSPIEDPYIEILILGSIPGDRSIEISEYYGHTRNRFWKVIAFLTQEELPDTYTEKKLFLLSKNIGVWDVAHTANRKGSLDSAIQNVVPNNLEDFIEKHAFLKTIGFNGKKAEALYDRYFKRIPHIRYICLPSTSPANATIQFNTLCIAWLQLLDK